MFDRTARLRLKRKLHRRKQHVEGVGDQAEQHIDRHIFRRINRLAGVRRFVLSWLLLLVLMSGLTIAQVRSLGSLYLESQPVAGGTYREGMVGAFTNANPLFATSLADTTISELVFSGLFKRNASNKLVNDLAQSMEVNEAGDVYTVKLKPNLYWHDGKPLTADDVVYTFQMAGHPDAKSPLLPTWRNVTVAAVDSRTVTFTLKNPLASFPLSLITGIVPKHILQDFRPQELRSSNFNTLQPVGSGPFRWESVDTVGTGREEIQQQISLSTYSQYHNGAPKLQRFVVHTYANTDQLREGFASQEINAMLGLDAVPDEFNGKEGIQVYSTPIMAANMAFFKTDSEILKDVKVRTALLRAVDRSEVISQLGYPAIPVDQAVLKSHFTYEKKQAQPGYDLEAANKLLDEAGWQRQSDGIRQKDNSVLRLKLYAQNTPDFATVASQLQQMWSDVGVQLDVMLQSPQDLQGTVQNRTYDVLLSGITIGTDPDIFAFWHSSQADARSGSRLNFSHYKNDTADEALENERTRTEPELRKVKFEPFLTQWRKDVPAIGLYQPQFLYVTRGQVFGYNIRRISYPIDRLWNVHEWMIREAEVIRQE